MSVSLDALVPELRDFAHALVDAASSAGLQPRVTSTLRSRAEQKRVYDRYLAGSSPFPAAPPGSSAHEYGWAFDLVPASIDVNWQRALKDLRALARLWKRWGGAWGGAFHDPVHFELPGASARAAALGKALPEPKTGLFGHAIDIVSGLPFGLTPSLILDFFGIPTNARKDVTPEQLAYLATLVPKG